MSPEAMKQSALKPWNPKGSIPLRKWLRPTRNEHDDQRLKCLGNIVFPRCAQLAMHQHEHELRFGCDK